MAKPISGPGDAPLRDTAAAPDGKPADGHAADGSASGRHPAGGYEVPPEAATERSTTERSTTGRASDGHTTGALPGGFRDPSRDGAVAFRAVMRAMACPGRIHAVDGPTPDGLSPAAAVVLLTLADGTTPVRLLGQAARARSWLTFHTGAPDAEPVDAVFAVGRWDDLTPLDAWPIGTPDYPDRSTTLVVEMDRLANDGPSLRGPGIADRVRLSLPDAAVLARNAALYPQGIDLILTCGDRLAALPRSTRQAEDL